AVSARLGDDRQPGRPRTLPDRLGGDRDRRRRRAARGANSGALEPTADRRGARPPREPPRRGVTADGRPGLARPAHALLREEPPRSRADPPLHRRAARRRLGTVAVPRGLHTGPAPGDRAAPARG